MPLWNFAEQTPGSQTQHETATTQAQPVASTPVKPADPQKQAPAQAQPQAQAQIWSPALAQPLRPAPAQPTSAQPLPGGGGGARRMPSESLIDEDRLSNFPEKMVTLINV